MNHPARSTDRRRTTRLATRLLAVMTLALAAGACTHPHPPDPRPTTTTTTPGPIMCPLATDGVTPIRPCPCPLALDDTAPVRRCPPCPLTDSPTGAAPDVIRPCPAPTGIPGVIAARGFTAYVDAMPGSTPTLIVTGTLVFATGGWGAKIRPASPQGINPKILLMEVVTDAPKGPVTQVLTPIDVRYEAPASPGSYDSVTILGLGLNLKVTVAY
jgi:hypothetical protein